MVCCVDEEDEDGVNISHDISPGGLVNGILLLLELQFLLTLTSLALAPRVNEFDLNATVGGLVPASELSEHNHILLSVHLYDVPDIHISPSNTTSVLPGWLPPEFTSTILEFVTDQQHVCVIET